MMKFQDWGEIPYNDAWQRQEQMMQQQVTRKMGGQPTESTLVFCSHPHVYTLGKSGKAGNMLYDDGTIPFVKTNRGGDITYHGPGQITGYPIFDIENYHLGLKHYIYNVEEAIIRTIALYGIVGERLEGATGVWIEAHTPRARKICAIGVRASHFVTMHGFALNVNTDLTYFQRINPCGFVDKGVTSIAKEIGAEADYELVKQQLHQKFIEVFESDK